MDVKVNILRYNPETDRKGHWEEYILEADPDERILDLLHKVKWFDDGSLAFRRSCAQEFVDLMQWLLMGKTC